jgi:hypothetical protein
MSTKNVLEKEIQALRVKQSRIEARQKKANEEVWSRIETIEKIALEKPGADAGNEIPPSIQIAINKVARRRGWKYY